MNCVFEKQGKKQVCKNCGFSLEIEGPLFKECTSTAPSFPPLMEQAKNFVGSVVEYVKSGFDDVTDEEHAKRMEICQGCEFFHNGSCQKCGCSCNFKARMRAMKCPLNKWPNDSSSST